MLGNEAFGVDLIGYVWKDSAIVKARDMAFGSNGSLQLLADRPAALDVALGSFRSLAVISKQIVKGFFAKDRYELRILSALILP